MDALMYIVVVGIILFIGNKYRKAGGRPKLEPFQGIDGHEMLYIMEDGSARELYPDEIEYLGEEFDPTDGARPYIKTKYKDLTPDGKISGFLYRSKLPEDVKIIAE